MKHKIEKIIEKSILALQKEAKNHKFEISNFSVEACSKKEYGDYAANIALKAAKHLNKDPMEIAKMILAKISFLGLDKHFSKIEAVEPGFINFFLPKKYFQSKVKDILKKGDKFCRLNIGRNRRVNIEFISANPTGPLTLGNGRGGFYGDALSNVFEMAGYKVVREYYLNDRGEQIKKLGYSLINPNKAFYKGDYILALSKRIKNNDPVRAGKEGSRIILEEAIKPLLKKSGIRFDKYFSEASLYNKGEVKKVLSILKNKNLVYEKNKALWFKSSTFGDDKDRVLVKADGEYTYFISDIAYLKNKFERGFSFLIYIWGADHYGYIKRMQAAARALGYDTKRIHFVIIQFVSLVENGKKTKMSKRKGSYVTLKELIDLVGLDFARFLFLTRSPGSHLFFDLKLAKEHSKKNPVYYVQYAFARICSLIKKAENSKILGTKPKVNLLNSPYEIELIRKLVAFPEIIEEISFDLQAQKLPNYALELAEKFHQFYTKCQVISNDKELSEARLALALATKIVLKNVLKVMGISRPKKM